eukprot:scaffold5802_cov22-Prasinocladus_malaysianus.AAC.1
MTRAGSNIDLRVLLVIYLCPCFTARYLSAPMHMHLTATALMRPQRHGKVRTVYMLLMGEIVIYIKLTQCLHGYVRVITATDGILSHGSGRRAWPGA